MIIEVALAALGLLCLGATLLARRQPLQWWAVATGTVGIISAVIAIFLVTVPGIP